MHASFQEDVCGRRSSSSEQSKTSAGRCERYSPSCISWTTRAQLNSHWQLAHPTQQTSFAEPGPTATHTQKAAISELLCRVCNAASFCFVVPARFDDDALDPPFQPFMGRCCQTAVVAVPSFAGHEFDTRSFRCVAAAVGFQLRRQAGGRDSSLPRQHLEVQPSAWEACRWRLAPPFCGVASNPILLPAAAPGSLVCRSPASPTCAPPVSHLSVSDTGPTAA